MIRNCHGTFMTRHRHPTVVLNPDIPLPYGMSGYRMVCTTRNNIPYGMIDLPLVSLIYRTVCLIYRTVSSKNAVTVFCPIFYRILSFFPCTRTMYIAYDCSLCTSSREEEHFCGVVRIPRRGLKFELRCLEMNFYVRVSVYIHFCERTFNQGSNISFDTIRV